MRLLATPREHRRGITGERKRYYVDFTVQFTAEEHAVIVNREMRDKYIVVGPSGSIIDWLIARHKGEEGIREITLLNLLDNPSFTVAATDPVHVENIIGSVKEQLTKLKDMLLIAAEPI